MDKMINSRLLIISTPVRCDYQSRTLMSKLRKFLLQIIDKILLDGAYIFFWCEAGINTIRQQNFLLPIFSENYFISIIFFV